MFILESQDAHEKEEHLKIRYAFALLVLIPLVLWGAVETKTVSGSPKGSVAEGEKVFNANCNMCHYADKTENKMGPGMKGLFKNKELPASHKPATGANVREQILNGSPHAKPMPMPAFADKLKPEQIVSLIQYLKTL